MLSARHRLACMMIPVLLPLLGVEDSGGVHDAFHEHHVSLHIVVVRVIKHGQLREGGAA